MKRFLKRKKVCGLLTAILLVMTFIVISPLHADIYVYRDGQGVLHFTNVPTSLEYTAFMSEANLNSTIYAKSSCYDDVIAEAARKNNVSFHLIKALIHVESYFNPNAISKKGALGLMQIMPENLSTLNVSHPFDPWENVMGGSSYLKNMLTRFDGKLELALAAYNAGPSAVEKYSDIPPYRETQEYVQKVLAMYRRYKNT
jgi:soluble lytic murein transglycosylase